MPPRSSPHDQTHWLSRAEEARELARQLTNPGGRDLMNEIAEVYEQLATYAAERSKSAAAD